MAQQPFVATEERPTICAADREAMWSMETRKTAAELGIVSVLIAVADTHSRRFRSGVDRFAPRVRSLEVEIVAETLGPFELHRVVVTPRRIRDREIGPVETIRPALICAR